MPTDKQKTLNTFGGIFVGCIILLIFFGIFFASENNFYEYVLQKTICSNINDYQVRVNTSVILNFPQQSMIFFKTPNSMYDPGTEYTCWFNPFNGQMDLSKFSTLSGTINKIYLMTNYLDPIFYNDTSILTPIYVVILVILCGCAVFSMVAISYILCKSRDYIEINDDEIRINFCSQ
jgi:hypothetical protein